MGFRVLALILTIAAAAGFLILGAVHVINLIDPAIGWPSSAPRGLLFYGLFPLYACAILLAWTLLKGRQSDASERENSLAASFKDVGWPFWLAIALFGYATVIGLATGDMVATGWMIRPVNPLSARLESVSLMPFYLIGLGIFYTCYRAKATGPADPEPPDRGG